jgi:N,N'-diacetyllegionaminate synthase
MKNIKIANRLVGEGCATFIIAEAGVNHNGDIKLAKKLIDIAKQAGADAVKFQTFQTDSLVTSTADKAPYQKETTDISESQYDMLKKLELKPAEFRELSDYTMSEGLIFLSSPFDIFSVDLLDEMGISAFKIPSGEITNVPLLVYVSRKGKPVILATGMSTLDEVDEAVTLLREEGRNDTILLHCVSAYPARVEDSNLKAMDTMRRKFKIPVGFSDHTPGIEVTIAAVALGACVIEKHFTIDKKMSGPDHRASLDPSELEEMVRAIRNVEKSIGDGIKKPVTAELENKKAVRRSLVARVDLTTGTCITENMLDIKRPSTGINPRDMNKVIGKKVKRSVKAGELIFFADLE